jgi:hypothetical protein
MNSVTDVAPVRSRVSRLNKVVVAFYVAAIVVATIGWLSAFAWISVTVLKWLLT